MESVLCMVTPITFRLDSVHFLNCKLCPKYINLVFVGFIFRCIESIQFLTITMAFSMLSLHFNSAVLSFAWKFVLMLWSSAKPLSDKSDGITSPSGEQYKLKIFASAQDPWGTLYVRPLSEL